MRGFSVLKVFWGALMARLQRVLALYLRWDGRHLGFLLRHFFPFILDCALEIYSK
jgi:hypothetical protein